MAPKCSSPLITVTATWTFLSNAFTAYLVKAPFNHLYTLLLTVIPAKLVTQPEPSGWARLHHGRAEVQSSSAQKPAPEADTMQEPCQGKCKPHPLQFAVANEKLQDQL